MYLSKLTLNPGNPQARRDLGSAYEMHRTLARAFVVDDQSPPARFLWRLERRTDYQPSCIVLVQSAISANWKFLDSLNGYSANIQGNKHIDLDVLIRNGAHYRFRLLANPTVTRNGKRYGIFREEEQMNWLWKQGEKFGFSLRGCVRGTSERMRIQQGQRPGKIILDTALFEGVLEAKNTIHLSEGVLKGIGHAKAFGLGLLSLARL